MTSEAVIRLAAFSAVFAAVREALEKLPPEQRQVIELMYFGGQSQSRIAERLELPLGTVKSRTLLGMRRLRGELMGIER